MGVLAETAKAVNLKWINEVTEKFEKSEFDVDTGTYMEDVHSNDLTGNDVDGNGLIDNVEELIENAQERADEYNEEQDRINRERIERKTEEEKDERSLDISL